jgi:hypothetical protein
VKWRGTARGVVVAAVAVAALLAGCGSNALTPPTRTPTAGPASSPVPDLTLPPDGSSASPGPSLGLPEASALPPGLDGLLACNNDPLTFSADALRQPPTAELRADAASIGLRHYVTVEAPPEMRMPRSGWREVARTDTSVTFIAPADDGWRVATMAPEGAGWTFSEGGNCDLKVQLPEGVSFASWRLDPAHPTNASSAEVRVLGTEMACANGDAPNGRVLAPVILSTDEAVTIALVVRTVPGGADCPGNPEFPFSITLDEPLGTRKLFDGSSFPPAPRT